MSKPVFRSIGAPLEVSDEALNALSDKLGVPSLVKPAQAPAPAPDPASDARSPAPGATHAEPLVNLPDAAAAAPAYSEALPPPEKLTFEVPGYLAQAMRRDCAEKRVTQRYLVLRGLQAIGYKIDPADLAPDQRRSQYKNRRP